MADTTHNVTIKATLDTSSIGGSSGGTGGGQGGGSSGGSNGIGIVQAATLQATNAMAQGLQSVREALTDFKRFSTQFNAIVTGFQALDLELKRIYVAIKPLYTALGGTAQNLKNLSSRVRQAEEQLYGFVELGDEMRRTAEFAGMFLQTEEAQEAEIKKETEARKENIRELKKSTKAQVDQTIDMAKLVKALIGGAMAGQVLNSAENFYKKHGDISEFENFVLKALKQGGIGAATGAATGSVVPGIGTGFGAAVGAIGGIGSAAFDSISEFIESNDTKIAEMSQAVEAQTRKQRQVLEQTMELVHGRIKFFARESLTDEITADKVSETIAQMDDTINRLNQDLMNLGSDLVLNRISLEAYNKKQADLQTALEQETQLRDKLLDRQNAEIEQINRETEARRQGMDYLEKLTYGDILEQTKGRIQDVAKYGSWAQVLDELSTQGENNKQLQERSREYLREMTDALTEGRFDDYEASRVKFERTRSNLEFGIGMRGQLAQALQEIFKETMTYKGLSARDMGTLAGLGGFGSETVMSDPVIDLQREQTRILGDMLRAIREQDRSSRYL